MKNYIISWVSTFGLLQHIHQPSAGLGLSITGSGVRKHFAATAVPVGSCCARSQLAPVGRWDDDVAAAAQPRGRVRGVTPLLRCSSSDPAMPLWDGKALGEHHQAVTRPLPLLRLGTSAPPCTSLPSPSLLAALTLPACW